jgi:hypothetical protein
MASQSASSDAADPPPVPFSGVDPPLVFAAPAAVGPVASALPGSASGESHNVRTLQEGDVVDATGASRKRMRLLPGACYCVALASRLAVVGIQNNVNVAHAQVSLQSAPPRRRRVADPRVSRRARPHPSRAAPPCRHPPLSRANRGTVLTYCVKFCICICICLVGVTPPRGSRRAVAGCAATLRRSLPPLPCKRTATVVAAQDKVNPGRHNGLPTDVRP